MVLSNEKNTKAENDFVKYIMETKGGKLLKEHRAEKFTRVSF